MSMRIVGLSGNLTRPSKTRALVEAIVGRVAGRFDATGVVFDLRDFAPSLGNATRRIDLDPDADRALAAVTDADLLVVASPVYKGSYTGLFKHLFDLLEPGCLAGKPVLLAATGGGDRHALVIEHQLRPLFGFFEAATLGTGVYACRAGLHGRRAPLGGPVRTVGTRDRAVRTAYVGGRAGSPQSRAAPARGSDGLREVGETSSTFARVRFDRPGRRSACRAQTPAEGTSHDQTDQTRRLPSGRRTAYRRLAPPRRAVRRGDELRVPQTARADGGARASSTPTSSRTTCRWDSAAAGKAATPRSSASSR